MDESYCMNLCSGLGTWLNAAGGRKFVRNKDKCLKSLKRMRKEINADLKDEKNKTVILLGDLQVLKNFLIPLAKTCKGQEDERILVEAAKVAVQLTMPIALSDKGNEARRMLHLQQFKANFLNKGAMHQFLSLLDRPLASTQKRQEDKLVVELILWLLRNLLAVPDRSSKAVSGSTQNAHLSHLHEDFLLMLKDECIFDIILFLGEFVGAEGNHDWNLILLDIFYQIFRGTRVEDLFLDDESRGIGAPASAAVNSNDDLVSLQARSHAKRVQANRSLSSRHSRFGGMFHLSNKLNAGAGSLVSNAFELSGQQKRSVASDMADQRVAKKRKKGRKGESNDVLATSVVDHIIGNDVNKYASGRRVRKLHRSVGAELLARCYKPLFEALIKDFRREDIRLLPGDQVSYLWLSGMCMGFERLRVTKEGTLASHKWDQSPVLTTLDMWNFHFVLKSCQIYSDESKWKELAIAVRALKEMVQILEAIQAHSKVPEVLKFCEKLRNSAFHDITEYDIIAKLIKEWKESQHSWPYLCDLAWLGHAMHQIADKMAEEGVVVRTKRRETKSLAKARERASRAQEKERKRLGKPWTPEETHALAAAVQTYEPTAKGFRKALKDPALGQVFDASRKDSQLVFRWAQVTQGMQDHGIQSLDAWIAHEIEQGDLEEEGNDFGDQERENEELNPEQRREQLEQLRAEREFVVEPMMRRYADHEAIENLCLLLDPRRVPSYIKAGHVLALHEGALLGFLRYFVASAHVANLWSLSLLGIYGRVLQTYSAADRPALRPVVCDIVQQFFKLAQENPLVYVEVLFSRNKQENLMMLNHYEDPIVRKQRAAQEALEEQRKLDEEQRGQVASSDDGGAEFIYESYSDEESVSSVSSSSSLGSLSASVSSNRKSKKMKKTGKHKAKKRRVRKTRKVAKGKRASSAPRAPQYSDGSEEEADLDTIGFCGVTKKLTAPLAHAKAGSGGTVSWDADQAAKVAEFCEANWDAMPPREVFRAIAAEPWAKKSTKNWRDVEHFVERAQLAPRTAIPVCSDEKVESIMRKVMRSSTCSESLRWVQYKLEDQEPVVVPTLDEHFDWLEDSDVQELLSALGFSRDFEFWVSSIPAARRAKLGEHLSSIHDKLLGQVDDDGDDDPTVAPMQGASSEQS